MDVNKFKVGGFVEIRLSPRKEDSGLWKIVEAYEMKDDNESFYRIKLDQDESELGDEIWAEYYPSMPKRLAILREEDSFPIDQAQSWPPPTGIIIDEIEFTTLDPEANDEQHDGFEAFNDGEEYTHWEYEDEESKNLLQITLVDSYVTMYRGYSLNTGLVKLI